MFYIVPRKIYLQHHNNPFGTHFAEALALDLPDGVHVLLRANFVNMAKSQIFEAHPNVICLPHAFSGKSIGGKAAPHVAHWGLTKDHTTFDVAEAASLQHSAMKIRHW